MGPPSSSVAMMAGSVEEEMMSAGVQGMHLSGSGGELWGREGGRGPA